MSLRARNRVNIQFSMSSMTDIVFLLLIFFMLTSTLVAPPALKVLLPKGKNQAQAKAITTVTITKDLGFYIETTPVDINTLEFRLQKKMEGSEDPTISLHADKSVPYEFIVKVMNIAKNNKYKVILATDPS
ncbi:MAG: biopolymer transporter ExbD [Bacteroidetes bacterium]|nr:biopolymer transporter ExbD [Bacteroidota bacterium]